MLPACTSSQKAYMVGSNNAVYFYPGSEGDSPGESCMAFSAVTSNQISASEAHQCKVSATIYPVIKVCEPIFDGAPYDYAAGGALFGFAFTGVMILYFSSLGIGHVIKAVRDM